MPRKKLTAVFVEKRQEPAGARVDYFDTIVPGLALRVSGPAGSSAGSKSWAVFYRHRGKLVRDTIGSVEKFDLAQARDQARALQQLAAKGEDPRERKKAGAPERPADTIENVVDLFMDRYMKAKGRSPRYIVETRRNFANPVLPR
ncbi:MAG: hypothetical protein JWL84_4964, partial [Rhodospirillales bacterium]|nr:hypothetical protein [Rhodospirillales bacterium]